MSDLALRDVKRSIITAGQILLYFGVLDGFGHVSARHPRRPNNFLLPKRLAPGLVTENDIIEFGPDAEPVTESDSAVFLERFIHGAIYEARPDIAAVVHSHSPAMIAASVVPTAPFRPICHTCGFLGDGAPTFEIRDTAGDATSLLISSRALGQALARSLGDAHVVLMRGHGSTATGTSVAQATYRAIYSETNARIRAEAAGFGEITYLSAAEAAAAEETSALQVERNWAYWISLLPRIG